MSISGTETPLRRDKVRWKVIMAYPYVNYRQRLAQGEDVTGKNLLFQSELNDEQSSKLITFVDTVAMLMVLLVAGRIASRLLSLTGTGIGQAFQAITDPYVWVFNQLFSDRPQLLLAAIEPGSLVALAFFPLVAWAIRGLIYETYHGQYGQLAERQVRSGS